MRIPCACPTRQCGPYPCAAGCCPSCNPSPLTHFCHHCPPLIFHPHSPTLTLATHLPCRAALPLPRLVYLDADMVVTRNIDVLFGLPPGFWAAGDCAFGRPTQEERDECALFCSGRPPYFNAGGVEGGGGSAG